MKIDKVSIAIKPNNYRLFRNLNNTPSNTVAEFVDNAIQSYENNKAIIRQMDKYYKLIIEIDIDKHRDIITIKDNAAGIDEKNFERAFEPSNLNKDLSNLTPEQSLHEFGVGMKTAAVWLSDKWTVKTKAFREKVERTISFDLNEVVKSGIEELAVTETTKNIFDHYTHIELRQLSVNAPSSNQIPKIAKHLSSIYRCYLRSDEFQIFLNGERLLAPESPILVAPVHTKTEIKGEPVKWKVDNINISYGEYNVKGWIGLLDTMANGQNGLVLLRDKRVILGGADDRYFHPAINGNPGSPRYKRLFGELTLKGFNVSFNKNHFIEVEVIDELMLRIAEYCKTCEHNILEQGDWFRLKNQKEMEKLAKSSMQFFQKTDSNIKLQDRYEQNLTQKNLAKRNREFNPVNIDTAESIDGFRNDEYINIDNQQYLIETEMYDVRQGPLYSVELEDINHPIFGCRVIHCRINIAHSFFTRYSILKTGKDFAPFIDLFKSLALAEIAVKVRGEEKSLSIREMFNLYV